MFEKISRAAEQAATSVSRRAFLGKLSQGALTAAGVLAAVLALPGIVEAGRYKCCCTVTGYCYRISSGLCSEYDTPCKCHKGCY